MYIFVISSSNKYVDANKCESMQIGFATVFFFIICSLGNDNHACITYKKQRRTEMGADR